MNLRVQHTIIHILELSAQAYDFRWLAIRAGSLPEPLVHPQGLRDEIDRHLSSVSDWLNESQSKSASYHPGTSAHSTAHGTSTRVATHSGQLRATHLLCNNGHPIGQLVVQDAFSDADANAQKKALLRIAHMLETQLEASQFSEQTNEELEHSFIINRAILNTLYDAVVMTDMEGRIQSVNPAMERMFGYSESDLINEPITKLMPPEIARHHPDFMAAYANGQTRGEIMGNLRAVEGLRADGSRFTLQIAVTETAVKSERLLVAAMQDITEGQQARINLERFRKTLDSTLDCVFMFDAHSLQFFYVNRGAVHQLGYSRKELLKLHPYDIKPLYPERQFREMIAPLLNQEVRQLKFQTLHRHKDGHDIPVDVLLQYVHLEDDPPRFIAVVRDFSEQMRHQEEIEHLAYYDPLTNLPNRSLIRSRLENVLRRCQEHKTFGMVMLTDLDDFKSVNDTLGHRNGDELLVEISSRFADALGNKDSISRLGGDEFLVVIETQITDRETANDHAQEVAKQLLAAATYPTRTLGTARPVSTSIGVVVFNSSETSSSELMRMADIAMYDAKRRGKNLYSLFDDAMQQQLIEEHHLTADLNQALSAHDQIVPWFQSKVNETGTCVGFEALARWQHPERGLLNPGQFIDLAEKKNLMTPLSDQILFKACQWMSQWRSQFVIDDWTMSVNVSQSQLARPDFPAKVEQTLTDTGLPAHVLMLEVTESILAEDIDANIAQMAQLRALGVRFSLDDFGTGYSSLSYLRQLPIDELKIDRSFVATLLNDEESHEIVKVILMLANSLNLSVVAEGIEEKCQWETLTRLGCTRFQGFFFCRPQSPEATLDAITQQQP